MSGPFSTENECLATKVTYSNISILTDSIIQLFEKINHQTIIFNIFVHTVTAFLLDFFRVSLSLPNLHFIKISSLKMLSCIHVLKSLLLQGLKIVFGI